MRGDTVHIIFCQKENEQYILQYCGGGHFGFMISKLKMVSEMTYSYKIHIEKWYYTSFCDDK